MRPAIKLAITLALVGTVAYPTTHAQSLLKNQLKPPSLATPSKNIRPQQIPLNLPTQNFGFFCRQELKMQRAHIPVSFRVGTMDQCNMLEQKPGYK